MGRSHVGGERGSVQEREETTGSAADVEAVVLVHWNHFLYSDATPGEEREREGQREIFGEAGREGVPRGYRLGFWKERGRRPRGGFAMIGKKEVVNIGS